MKKLLVLLALALGLNASASHIMGGMIGVVQTSQDSTSVGMYLISDGQGVPMPQVIHIEKWEMNSVGGYVQNGYITVERSSINTFQGQSITNYVSDYLDLDSNKYRFIYRDCCWGMLNNSQNSFNSGFIISADYWHIPYNSTPYALNPLWINLQKDTLNSMKPIWGIINCFMNEIDGDSVEVSQTDLYMGYTNGVFISQTYTQLSMHVDNDSISWTPTTLGRFGTGFMVKDYRNGQLIGTQRVQWTFLVVASTVGIEEDIVYRDTQYSVYDWYGRYMGDNINWPELKGLYVIRYSNGKVEKVLCN